MYRLALHNFLCNLCQNWYKSLKLPLSYANIGTNLPWIFISSTYTINLFSICVIYTNIGTRPLSYDLSMPIFAQIYHSFYTINIQAKLMKHLCNLHQYWYKSIKLRLSYANFCTNLPWIFIPSTDMPNLWSICVMYTNIGTSL